MQTKDLTIKRIKSEYSNEYIQIVAPGAVAVFRISCSNDRKYNKDNWKVSNVYFEAETLPEGNFTQTYNVRYMTDLFLFVERHAQWLLDCCKHDTFPWVK